EERLARQVEAGHVLAQGHEHGMERLAAETVVEHPLPLVDTLEPPALVLLFVGKIVRDAREGVDRLDRGTDARGQEPGGDRKVFVVFARKAGAERARLAQAGCGAAGSIRFIERLGPGRRAGHATADDTTLAALHRPAVSPGAGARGLDYT